jgi:4-amino-4-deoxy-L-arabinose transferase-like glycosyltransferase
MALLRPHRLLLAAILVAGFALRVWHNDYSLPYVWGVDEGFHFVNRSVSMFRSDLDPGYYQNPAAFTYLVYALLRVMYGPLGFIFDLPFANLDEQYRKDPTEIWIAARTLAAVLCIGGVAATYHAASRIWSRREGIVAAALLCFAFLAVAYSRIAVTDAGVLIGVALALLGAVRAAESGRRRDFAAAGVGAGLALSFKYTGGLTLLPLAIAAGARLRGGERRDTAVSAAAALAVAGLVFLVLNPYLPGNLSEWWADLRGQADVTASVDKPGQEDSGLGYYLDSLWWGFGVLPALAALAGAAIELRRNLVRGLLLVSMPVALFVYLAVQSRYFGRWLLPAYPVLAMLAAVALARAAELVRGGPAARTGALAALTALLLIQPVIADVRTARVLGREDTRLQARDFLVSRYAPELRIAIEPAIPGRYYRVNPKGVDPPWLKRCPQRPRWTEPGFSYVDGYGRRVCQRFRPGQFTRPDGGVRASAYHLVLDRGVIDEYRRAGYCIVMTISTVRDRALETRLPGVRAYYGRLTRESDLLARFDPYEQGEDAVPFHFDKSFNYEPRQFERPGPVVHLYRLRDCTQRYGAPRERLPRAREEAPDAPDDTQTG